MQLKNIAIGKKIWLILWTVIAILVAAASGQAYLLNRAHTEVLTEALRASERQAQIEQLRLLTDLLSENILAAAISSEIKVIRQLRPKQTAYMQQIQTVGETFLQTTRSEEVRHLILETRDWRGKVYELSLKIQELQDHGEYAQALQQQQQHLVPAMANWHNVLQTVQAVQQRNLEQAMARSKKDFSNVFVLSALAIATAVVLGLLLGRMVVRQIIAPLEHAVALADHIADGDLTHHVHDDRQDELGSLLHSLSTMTRRLLDILPSLKEGDSYRVQACA